MPTSATRSLLVRWVPFVVVVVAITVVSLSSSVAQWWAIQGTPGTSRLPAAVDPVLQARPNSSDADVHLVLWFVATLALVWAMRPHGWLRLTTATVAPLAYTGLLEVGNQRVPTRSPQWIDVVGNGLGIVAGLAVGAVVVALLPDASADERFNPPRGRSS